MKLEYILIGDIQIFFFFFLQTICTYLCLSSFLVVIVCFSMIPLVFLLHRNVWHTFKYSTGPHAHQIYTPLCIHGTFYKPHQLLCSHNQNICLLSLAKYDPRKNQDQKKQCCAKIDITRGSCKIHAALHSHHCSSEGTYYFIFSKFLALQFIFLD